MQRVYCECCCLTGTRGHSNDTRGHSNESPLTAARPDELAGQCSVLLLLRPGGTKVRSGHRALRGPWGSALASSGGPAIGASCTQVSSARTSAREHGTALPCRRLFSAGVKPNCVVPQRPLHHPAGGNHRRCLHQSSHRGKAPKSLVQSTSEVTCLALKRSQQRLRRRCINGGRRQRVSRAREEAMDDSMPLLQQRCPAASQ